VMPSSRPPSSMRSTIPVVAYTRRAFLPILLSSRTPLPTSDESEPTTPGASPSSCETRSASEMALMRRGSVT
jgi:hypothetical protein